MKLAGRVLLMLAALVGTGGATTVIPMSVEEMTQAASAVVEGTAGESWSAWNPQHTLIYTYTKFQITRSWKGALPASVVVKQLGGQADGYMQKVAGVRYFQSGEPCVLFLRGSVAQDNTQVVVGLMQGNFRVYTSSRGETMVSNGMSEASAYEPGSGQFSPFRGSPMSLKAMESRVRQAVQK